MNLLVGAMTDKGLVRAHNEDSHLVMTAQGLFAVADGMGGHAAGEVASRIAIDAVREVFDDESLSPESVPELLRRAVERSNDRIAERIRSQPEYLGMGTTLVILLANSEQFWIAHVGDSRAYLIRNDEIIQLTTDHSFVNELVRLGMLSREEAARDPRRNVVTRALGSGSRVSPDIAQGSMQPGDVVLLCSDGLNTMLDDDEILAIVRRNGHDLPAACHQLVEAANHAGGEDNVTVVLAGLPTPASSGDSSTVHAAGLADYDGPTSPSDDGDPRSE